MKFKVKTKPKYWDIKKVIRFAYFPIRIDDTVIWLEKYECTYRHEYDRFWNSWYWNLIDEQLINEEE